MAPAFELHFTEANGVATATERLGPCATVEIDIPIAEPARFRLDPRSARLNSLTAHSVPIARGIAARCSAIAVGGRTIITAVSNLDKECGIVTNTGGNGSANRRAVRCSRKSEERRRSKGNDSRSRSHDVVHHEIQKTYRTGTVPDMSVHFPLPDEFGATHSFRHKNDPFRLISRIRRMKQRLTHA